jgi:hypothetical protein
MKAMANGRCREAKKEQMEEDVKMLRQVLDNLLAFSLSQEYAMVQFRISKGSPAFNKNIKQDLKLQFKHVDDSCSLSLRNPKLLKTLPKRLEMYITILTKRWLVYPTQPKGISHQQYAVSSANKLGDF